MAITKNMPIQQSAKEIVKDLLKELEDIFGEETYKTLESKLAALRKEGEKLQKDLNNVQNIIKQQQYSFSSHMNNNDAIYSVSIKIYVFIEKLREFFTKEVYEYLIYVGGKRQSTVQLKKATLEEILPFLGVIENSSKELKINLSMRRSQLKTIGQDIKVSNEKLVQTLNNFYLEMQKDFYYTRSKKTKKLRRIGKQRIKGKTQEQLREENIIKAQSGYAFEAATLAAISLGAEPNLSGTKLLNKLMKFYGAVRTGDSSRAFYRGGDISLDSIDANKLLSIAEPIELQLKNLTNGFASVAELKTLSTVLTAIMNLLSNKNLSPQSIASALNVYIFKAEKNIDNAIADSLADITEDELDKAFKNLGPNITGV